MYNINNYPSKALSLKKIPFNLPQWLCIYWALGDTRKKDYIPFEDFPKGFHQPYRVEGGPLFMPRASHPQAVPVLKEPKLGSD